MSISSTDQWFSSLREHQTYWWVHESPRRGPPNWISNKFLEAAAAGGPGGYAPLYRQMTVGPYFTHPPHLSLHPPHSSPTFAPGEINSPNHAFLTWLGFFSRQETALREFPGGPVVRTQHFHCRGRGFDPRSGN